MEYGQARGQRLAEHQALRHFEEAPLACEPSAHAVNKSPTSEWRLEDTKEIIQTCGKGHLGFTQEDVGG